MKIIYKWRCLVIEILFAILGAIIGILAGYLIRKTIGEGKINNAEELAKKTIEEAEKQGEARKKELLLEGKEEIHKLRTEAERENREEEVHPCRLTSLAGTGLLLPADNETICINR